MRKNKRLGILISLILPFSLTLSFTAFAQEEVSGDDVADTFEEFLALDEEELRTSLADYWTLYEETKEMAEYIHQSTSLTYQTFWVTYNENLEERYLTEGSTELNNFTIDTGLLMSDLKLPEDLLMDFFPVTVQSSQEVMIYFDHEAIAAYGYDVGETTAKIHIWMELNSLVNTVDHEGVYIETTTSAADEPPVMMVQLGDVNLDGRLSVLDVITLSKYNAQLITLNEDQLLACDCNGDGAADGEDVTAMMKCIVGIYDTLPYIS